MSELFEISETIDVYSRSTFYVCVCIGLCTCVCVCVCGDGGYDDCYLCVRLCACVCILSQKIWKNIYTRQLLHQRNKTQPLITDEYIKSFDSSLYFCIVFLTSESVYISWNEKLRPVAF